ncbi:MAG: hypothetical protein O7G85_03985 [Planctomycetota bacterium]|nr:hypothetical protein [Planctomycetota bacterium]
MSIKHPLRAHSRLILAFCFSLFALSNGALGQSETVFTYQGELTASGSPANGTYDLDFTLWDLDIGGVQIGSTISIVGVLVTDGKFAIDLDFGSVMNDTLARWLEIDVDTVTLSPRQHITGAPFSIRTRGIYVDDAGRVGIANSNPDPDAQLHVSSQGCDDFGILVDAFGAPGSRIGLHPGVGGWSSLAKYTYYGGPWTRFEDTYGAFLQEIDPDGNVSFFTAPAGAGSITWNTNLFLANDGDVGIGTNAPTARLHIVDPIGGQPCIRAANNWYAIRGTHDSTGGTFPGIWGDTNSTSNNATGMRGYVNSTSPGSGSAGIKGINNGTGANGYGVYGSQAGEGVGVYGITSGNGTGIKGVNNANGHGVIGTSIAGYGVRGESISFSGVSGDSDIGSGVYGHSVDGNGIYGISNNDYSILGITSSRTAVYGQANTGRGVQGTATNAGGVTYGVFGYAVSSSGFGLYSAGKCHIQGNLSKSSGSFKIDHPQDPANRYLSHSFVESPDMMNIYNGNITTDRDGYAQVEMPDYFHALNSEFRYQLTIIDVSDSDDFVMAKVTKTLSAGRFTIRTSHPNIHVSWQVTGVRHDAWAEAHRIVVEEDKSPEEQGKYLAPELYGYPASMGIHTPVPTKEPAPKSNG